MAKKKDNGQHAIFCQSSPWVKRDNSIWLASTLKFHRNLNKFKFPGKLDAEKRKQIVALIEQAIAEQKRLKNTTIYHAENLDPLHKEFLMEQFFGTESLQRAHTGECFALDEKSNFLAIMNIRDHLQLQIADYDGELERSLNDLIEIESQLCQSLDFAFNSQFGFLTADPSGCGTGLTVNTYLQLPMLIHSDQMSAKINRCKNEGVRVTGLLGDPENFLGSVVVLSNNFTLGVTEETIVSTVRSCATKMMVDEQSRRSELQKDDGHLFKDKVSRAFGLLTHSYQIQTLEAMDALSLVALGIDIGWVTGIKLGEAHNLFWNCRRAHLTGCQAGTDGDVPAQELPRIRAEYLRKGLKKAKLAL